MDEICISVVVPTYNQEKYIGQALQSIVDQEINVTYEVLVGDDCSTDQTAAIIQDYANKYPAVIIPVIREKNLGGSQNMGELVMRSKGKYVAFLEGDDYWIDTKKLQKQWNFMESHEDYVATFGRSIVVDAEGNRNQEIEQYLNFFDGNEFLMENFKNYQLPGQTCTAFYRRSAFMQMMQNASKVTFEIKYMLADRMLVLPMMAVGKIWNTQEIVSAYRYVLTEGSGSWSSQNDYFNYQNEYNFLMGLKELEMVAEVFGLPLCYDDRRQYEMCVLGDHKQDLTKDELDKLRRLIMDTAKDKKGMMSFLIKRKKDYLLNKHK